MPFHSFEALPFPNREAVYERIPREAMTLIPNQAVKGEFEDPFMEEMLTDPERLLETAGLFTFGSPFLSEGSVRRHVPQNATRSALLNHFMSPVVVLHLPYSEETSKGSGTGYGQINSALQTVTGKDEPIGLFGLEDAMQEMTIGNLYAHSNIRAGRVLGIIVLDYRQCMKWIQSLEKQHDRSYSEILGRILTVVDNNQDIPAIVIRLTHGRYADLQLYTDTDPYHMRPAQSLYSNENLLATTKDLHLAEMKSRGGVEAFMKNYGIDDRRIGMFLTLLTQGEEIQRVRDPNWLRLESYLYAFCLGRIAYLTLSGKLKELYSPHSSQDISLGVFLQDHELTRRPVVRENIPQEINSLRYAARNWLYMYRYPPDEVLMDYAFDQGLQET